MEKCGCFGRVGLGAAAVLMAGLSLAQGTARAAAQGAAAPMPRVVEKDGRIRRIMG